MLGFLVSSVATTAMATSLFTRRDKSGWLDELDGIRGEALVAPDGEVAAAMHGTEPVPDDIGAPGSLAEWIDPGGGRASFEAAVAAGTAEFEAAPPAIGPPRFGAGGLERPVERATATGLPAPVGRPTAASSYAGLPYAGESGTELPPPPVSATGGPPRLLDAELPPGPMPSARVGEELPLPPAPIAQPDAGVEAEVAASTAAYAAPAPHRLHPEQMWHPDVAGAPAEPPPAEERVHGLHPLDEPAAGAFRFARLRPVGLDDLGASRPLPEVDDHRVPYVPSPEANLGGLIDGPVARRVRRDPTHPLVSVEDGLTSAACADAVEPPALTHDLPTVQSTPVPAPLGDVPPGAAAGFSSLVAEAPTTVGPIELDELTPDPIQGDPWAAAPIAEARAAIAPPMGAPAPVELARPAETVAGDEYPIPGQVTASAPAPSFDTSYEVRTVEHPSTPPGAEPSSVAPMADQPWAAPTVDPSSIPPVVDRPWVAPVVEPAPVPAAADQAWTAPIAHATASPPQASDQPTPAVTTPAVDSQREDPHAAPVFAWAAADAAPVGAEPEPWASALPEPLLPPATIAPEPVLPAAPVEPRFLPVADDGIVEMPGGHLRLGGGAGRHVVLDADGIHLALDAGWCWATTSATGAPIRIGFGTRSVRLAAGTLLVSREVDGSTFLAVIDGSGSVEGREPPSIVHAISVALVSADGEVQVDAASAAEMLADPVVAANLAADHER